MSDRADRIAAKRRLQHPNELHRKAQKAARPGWWTQEDIDYLKCGSVADEVRQKHELIFGRSNEIEGESSK